MDPAIFTFQKGKGKPAISVRLSRLTSILTNFPLIFLFIIVTTLITKTSFGQAANIDQIRNSLTYDNSTDPFWVNGNAGASNSHYMEGHSIAYRVLLTGLTSGKTYSIILGYDTKHSDHMALDYLTHYQRLEPHGPFGHAAEVINPLRMESGSNEYNMTVDAPDVLAFPEPDPVPPGYWNNADNGSHGGADDGTPVDNQPKNSFNNLPLAERVMTLWNGNFITMNYVLQETLTGASAQAETQIRIKFVASSDSVLFSWGGHIASRLDWGFVPGTTTPLSASGISGSPYHMRLKQFFVFQGAPIGNKTCNTDSCEVGIGNQDRSLSAAAVIPPPECNVSGPLKACPETTVLQYSTSVSGAGLTYLWQLLNNTANAIISGSNTGSSINVTPNPDAATADFTPGGSFNVKLTTTQNGITTECYLGSSTSPGDTVEIQNVQVDAQDADDALQLDLAASSSIALGIQSISPGTTADYNFQWELVSNAAGGNSSFTNATSASATFNVLSPYALGVYTVRVVATQKAAPNCVAVDTVTIDVSGGVNCGVSGPPLVCPGSTGNKYIYDPNFDGIADTIPGNFTLAWDLINNTNGASIPGGTTDTSVLVTTTTTCASAFTVRVILTSTSGIIRDTCSKTVSVNDVTPPVILTCPTDKNLSCGAATDTASNGYPTFSDNCSATLSYVDQTVSNCNRTVITRTWTVTDVCGNTATCTQTIILTDAVVPVITCPADTTLNCGESTLPASTGTATATDNCSAVANIIIYYKDAPAINVPCGNITRTWYAVDEAGNLSSCVQQIAFAVPTLTRVAEKENIAEQPVTPAQVTVPSNRKSIQLVKAPEVLPTLDIKAFPNPFKNTVNFRISSSQTGKARLEIYNSLGQKLGVAYEGFIKAGITQDVQYRVTGTRIPTMIYRLTVNGKSTNGKLFQE